MTLFEEEIRGLLSRRLLSSADLPTASAAPRLEEAVLPEFPAVTVSPGVPPEQQLSDILEREDRRRAHSLSVS